MDDNYENAQIWKEKLCKMRLELAAKNKTDPWTSDDLEIVVKNLKNGTSHGPYGFSNELFKKGIAGKYLKMAILKLMNKIKSQQKIPKSLQLCNISSLYKNTTPRKSFRSYRNIFRVTVLRSI